MNGVYSVLTHCSVVKGINLNFVFVPDVQDDLASADVNEDGNIDQSEAENLFDKRHAEQILQMADTDGKYEVTEIRILPVLQTIPSLSSSLYLYLFKMT